MVRSNIPSSLTIQDNTQISGISAGTLSASKALVVGSNSEINVLRIDALDSGISGTAGSIDIFPGTASKGKIALTAADNSGDTTTTIVNASQAGTRTYTIPDALASAQFLLGIGLLARTATSDGLSTGTIADAGFIQIVDVTSSSANNIIVLPSPVVGTIVVLAVGSNGFELRSDTTASVAISGGTGSSGESAIPADSMALLFCVTTTKWLGFDITATTLAAVEAAAN